ncbi:uncharacterized protein V1518DRAFT_415076 [Limtongia smithiae]|uniref:uncharacterized protein n=1 Tax=Limtongia smithiae TaxID=1125753 RepID=UPI0034CD2E23
MTFSLADISTFEAPTTVLVTGGTSGIGKVAVREFARHGARVYVTVRNAAKGTALLEEIAALQASTQAKADVKAEDVAAKAVVTYDVRLLECDFMDLKSLVKVAKEFGKMEPKLDILLNNAGTLYAPYTESDDGFESTLQVNYIGLFLLTRLLLPMLEKAEHPRVINVSSLAHKFATKFMFADPNMKDGMEVTNMGNRYAQSKLAVVLFTKEFAKRYPQILTVVVHPGVIADTGLYDNLGKSTVLGGLVRWFGIPTMKILDKVIGISTETGALTSIYCAVDKSLTPETDNGSYFIPVAKKASCSATGSDRKLAEELWSWTDKILVEKGYLSATEAQ